MIVLYIKLLLLAKIFHKDLGIAAVAQLRDALFANLTHTLSGKSKTIANLLKSLFWTSDAEALADNGYLTVFKHFIKYILKLKSHRLMINMSVCTAVITTCHHVEHTVVLTILEWRINRDVMTIGHKALSDLFLIEISCFAEL